MRQCSKNKPTPTRGKRAPKYLIAQMKSLRSAVKSNIQEVIESPRTADNIVVAETNLEKQNQSGLNGPD